MLFRGRPIHLFCRLIAATIGYRQKAMPIVSRFASIAGVAEKGPLALYSTRVTSRGGNDSMCCLFGHVTLRAAQRGKLQTRI